MLVSQFIIMLKPWIRLRVHVPFMPHVVFKISKSIGVCEYLANIWNNLEGELKEDNVIKL